MAKLARDVMTIDPACCTPRMTLDEVAKLMVQYNCGEIPVIDSRDQAVGVITDRDIVCRVVAEGKNPSGLPVELAMTRSVVTVSPDTPLDEVVLTMEEHQIRRVPVVDADGCCTGIVAQADVVSARDRDVAHLLREVSRDRSEGLRGH